MELYQQRMFNEKTELDINIGKALIFIELNGTFKLLDDEEQVRLKKQLDLMQAYSQILTERIAAFTK